MSQLSASQIDSPRYSFYVHEIVQNKPLQVLRLDPQMKIELTRDDLALNYTSLFTRPVTYLPPIHQEELTDIIELIQGLSDYLKGCAFLFSSKDLAKLTLKNDSEEFAKNPRDAFSFLMRSALDHLPAAQYLIGYCYLNSFTLCKKEKIAKNKTAAINWFQLAAAQGHQLSVMQLNELQTVPISEPIRLDTPKPAIPAPALYPQPYDYTSSSPYPIQNAVYGQHNRGYEQYDAIISNLMQNNQNLINHNHLLQGTICDLIQRIYYLETMLGLHNPTPFTEAVPAINSPEEQETSREESAPKRQRRWTPFTGKYSLK